MAKRKIIEINRELCNGCGLCTTACAEGALALDGEGKAVLVRELYCDGMGACLDVCPTTALQIVERESEDYSAPAAYQQVLQTRGAEAAAKVHGADGLPRPPFSSCPGSAACEIPLPAAGPQEEPLAAVRSQLTQWPIQLHLISPAAPYFRNADLLIAADCTAFALGSFHPDLLRGRKLVVACPKLDNATGYLEKLVELIRSQELQSLTVAIMTVPCCGGLLRLAQRAAEISGTTLPVNAVTIGIDGRILSRKTGDQASKPVGGP